MGVKDVYRMSEIDRAIQGLREAEILQQQSTQIDNNYLISNNTLNQSIQALHQAKKDREDDQKTINELAEYVIDLKIKYEPQTIKNRLDELNKLFDLG